MIYIVSVLVILALYFMFKLFQEVIYPDIRTRNMSEGEKVDWLEKYFGDK